LCPHGPKTLKTFKQANLVRAAGLEPAQRLLTEGFSYLLRLSPPEPRTFAQGPVWGLDYTFTITLPRRRCCPSSLYTFPGTMCSGLGSGLPVTGFPEFEQFYTSGFPEGTQLIKSLASTDSATPALTTKSDT
jgi:hypothetical protein